LRPEITPKELAGRHLSPSGFPPYLAMLYAYLDESGIHEGPACVVCGFLGTDTQWKAFESDWKLGLGQRAHLHMTELRWNRTERVGPLLSRLGPIPYKHGLTPIVSVVHRDLYERNFDGDFAKIITPLFLSFRKAAIGIGSWIEKHQPNETVKIVMERQDRLSPIVMDVWATLQRTDSIALKWFKEIGFIEKGESCCTEVADYLAFEAREYASSGKGNSQKAQLGISILGNLKTGRGIGGSHSQGELAQIARNIRTEMLRIWSKGGH
jgi:hypothetical protein